MSEEEKLAIKEHDEITAISIAIISGECNKCRYLKICESDRTFKFPDDAFCMRLLREKSTN